MNAAHIHLMVSHFPITGLVFAIFFLCLSILLKKEILKQMIYFFLIVVATTALPAFFSGEGAEHFVETWPDITESLVEAHEERAEQSIWSMLFVAVSASLSLLLSRTYGRTPRWSFVLTAAACFIALVLMGSTAYLGGLIRHPEINSSTPHQ